jgi:hypothetical protein
VARSWLKDPAFDLTLIFGVTLLACAMGGAVAVQPALFLPLLVFHSWCFSFDHVVATFTKLAGTPDDRRRNRFLIWGLPPLMLAATFAVGQSTGIGVLNTGYFWFQWFHTTRQSWGVAQHYRRAGAIDDPRWFTELVMWSLPVVGLLHRCHQQPTRFLWMSLFLPRVPSTVVLVAAVLACVLVAIFFWRRRQTLLAPHTLYIASHLVVFAVSYLVIDDLQAGWLVVNVWHNVQYLAYVWMHNRERADRGDLSGLLGWLCRPGATRGLLYFAACLIFSTAIFAPLYAAGDRLDLWLDGRAVSVSLVVALAVNFHHYIVDGLIWRQRRT